MSRPRRYARPKKKGPSFHTAAECPEEDKLKLTQTDYNRRTLAKQAEAGLVRVSVMVPKEDAAALKAMAAKLRDKR